MGKRVAGESSLFVEPHRSRSKSRWAAQAQLSGPLTHPLPFARGRDGACQPSPNHARAGRDRGDVAGGLVAARLRDGAERIEEARIEAGAVIDREVDGAVAEALQHLTEAADAVLALAPHLLEIDLD